MALRFHPTLVNDPLGDPGLYIRLQFERRALLFDLGDLTPLASRELLRLSDVFVSHMHLDHFCGFDRLLRIFLGRDRILRLYGPSGLIEAVGHKLDAYTWNLVGNYATDFTVAASELIAPDRVRTAELHSMSGFRPEGERECPIRDGVLLDEPGFRVRAAVLDHGIPCLGFSLEEYAHVGILKDAVEAMGLPVGPWLRELKQAILSGGADDRPFPIRWREAGQDKEKVLPLGSLRSELTRTIPGQKLAYVVDAAHTPANVERIIELARDADIVFIEAPFLQADAARAKARRHLTAQQAGELARKAGAKQLITFHYSPRYGDDSDALRREALAAFAAEPLPLVR